MIIEETFYGVKCDSCQEVYEGYNFSFWNDSGYAEENATDAGWHKEDDKHYCPSCHSFDDDDNLVLKVIEK